MEKTYIVEYNGKKIKTKNYVEISEEERILLKEEFFAEPTEDQVNNQIITLSKGGVMMDKITRKYFRKLMAKTQISTAKWTVEDVFNSKELLGIFKAKTLTNEKVFPKNKSLIKNIETAIQLGGKSYAKFPTQFPVKTVDYILNKYCFNNNYLDFSCGWGARLIGSLKNNINYYGIDPNYLLVEKLKELESDWKKNVPKCNSIVEIKTCGSEYFIPDFKNKMSLAFTSPPYYDLEDYKIGNQSYKEGTSYTDWLNNYMFPTLNNVYEYLIKDGILAINIKNINGATIEDDVKEYIIQNLKMTLLKIENLKNIKRTKSIGGKHNGDENIYIFIKQE